MESVEVDLDLVVATGTNDDLGTTKAFVDEDANAQRVNRESTAPFWEMPIWDGDVTIVKSIYQTNGSFVGGKKKKDTLFSLLFPTFVSEALCKAQ